MLFTMSTYEPEAEALAADNEDYSTQVLRERSYAPARQLATHGYRDADSGMPAELAGVDIDALLDDVEGRRF